MVTEQWIAFAVIGFGITLILGIYLGMKLADYIDRGGQ